MIDWKAHIMEYLRLVAISFIAIEIYRYLAEGHGMVI